MRFTLPALSVLAIVMLNGCSASCPTPPSGGCVTTGTGSISVTSTGLPAGVTGTITLTGPSVQTVTETRTLTGVSSGAWSVSAERATDADPLVRTVYVPAVSPPSFCLAPDGTQAVTVTWSKVATSNSLWAINGNATGQFLGIHSQKLTVSATITADIVTRAGIGKDLAFDQDGNVWVGAATVAQSGIQRFPSSAFATSGSAMPDRQIDIDLGGCSPGISALAFDRSGNLYAASPCSNKVYRLDASQLNADGTAVPALTISIQDPGGLAFDAAGNLWVAAGADSRIWRYDASQLVSGAVSTPAFKLGARVSDNTADSSLFVPSWLAFDSRGDLWGNAFGPGAFFRLSAAQTRGTGQLDVNPQVRITLQVLGLLEGFAFDGEGGLWSAGAQGTLIRLAPSQLDTSSGSGHPTAPQVVLTSADLGYASNLGFYPAPAALPLYHAIR